MKKIIIAAAILVSGLAFNKSADAQIRVNVNIGSQPDWGPAGYDYVDNYYLPDIDAYYSVPTHEYVYLDNNRWTRSRTLPARYRNYDIYNSYKVVVNDRNPWERDNTYRSRYANYRGRHDQVIIRNSKDVKYKNHGRSVVVKEKKVKYKGNNGRGNGWNNGNGHGRGR
ncbi:hypothetical protein ABDD95_00515 [Mucilaginibacter sp. PAMB04274]|uniref:hypothetical protein n=1 Tax=Mucilaginibacter sp. PAMB04274 TaxID=3138568 RepID=UPI0031F6D18E